MATNPLPLPPRPHTVAKLLDAYEKEHLPKKAPTTRYQQGKVFNILRRDLGFMLLTDLTPAFLRQWRDHLLHTLGYAPGTVCRYMDQLSGPLTQAVNYYEWLPTNPMRKVSKPPEPPARVRCLSEEELLRLVLACQRSRNPHLTTIVLLALSTGARKSQLRMLRWRDVDFAKGVVWLGASKRAKRRSLPLQGPVVEVLRHRSRDQAPEAWVFARYDGLKPTLIDQVFRQACKWGHIEDFRFHDLRHTCASFLAMSGAGLREIQEVLGHTTPTMSAKYVHPSSDHMAGIMGRMLQKHFGPTDPPTAPR